MVESSEAVDTAAANPNELDAVVPVEHVASPASAAISLHEGTIKAEDSNSYATVKSVGQLSYGGGLLTQNVALYVKIRGGKENFFNKGVAENLLIASIVFNAFAIALTSYLAWSKPANNDSQSILGSLISKLGQPDRSPIELVERAHKALEDLAVKKNAAPSGNAGADAAALAAAQATYEKAVASLKDKEAQIRRDETTATHSNGRLLESLNKLASFLGLVVLILNLVISGIVPTNLVIVPSSSPPPPPLAEAAAAPL